MLRLVLTELLDVQAADILAKGGINAEVHEDRTFKFLMLYYFCLGRSEKLK